MWLRHLLPGPVGHFLTSGEPDISSVLGVSKQLFQHVEPTDAADALGMTCQPEVPSKSVDAVPLGLPNIPNLLGGHPVCLEVGPVVHHPLHGQFNEARVLAPPHEHIGHVIVHEVAVVCEAQLLDQFKGPITDEPIRSPEAGRLYTYLLKAFQGFQENAPLAL